MAVALIGADQVAVGEALDADVQAGEVHRLDAVAAAAAGELGFVGGRQDEFWIEVFEDNGFRVRGNEVESGLGGEGRAQGDGVVVLGGEVAGEEKLFAVDAGAELGGARGDFQALGQEIGGQGLGDWVIEIDDDLAWFVSGDERTNLGGLERFDLADSGVLSLRQAGGGRGVGQTFEGSEFPFLGRRERRGGSDPQHEGHRAVL